MIFELSDWTAFRDQAPKRADGLERASLRISSAWPAHNDPEKTENLVKLSQSEQANFLCKELETLEPYLRPTHIDQMTVLAWANHLVGVIGREGLT